AARCSENEPACKSQSWHSAQDEENLMRVYRLETIGNLDGLVAREEARPVPSAGEVLVRVKASALNFRDLAILSGTSPFPVRPGVVPISDAADGEQEDDARDSTLTVGDRVVRKQ